MLSKSLIQFSVEGWSCVPSERFYKLPKVIRLINYRGRIHNKMRVNIKVVCDPFTLLLTSHRGFTGGLDGKESACNAGDTDSIPG